MEASNKESKRLKVLCIHGHNNTSDIFKFQMKNFIKSYEKYIDFIFLDGPFACGMLPIPQLIKMGFDGCEV